MRGRLVKVVSFEQIPDHGLRDPSAYRSGTAMPSPGSSAACARSRRPAFG